MNIASLFEYKGILLITGIIIAIMYYSKDLEGVLLMTGIIVNVIAICLNTGATKFTGSKVPETFLPPRRYDLVEKFKGKSQPRYEELNKGYDKLLPNVPKKEYESRVPKYSEKSPPNKEPPVIGIAGKYKGAVDYDGCSPGEMYPEVGMDRATKLSLDRQGINFERQVSGSMRRRKVMQPMLCAELTDSENKDWWSSFDA